MSGRRRSPPPPPRRSDQYSAPSESRRGEYLASSRYDVAPARRRSPSPRGGRGGRQDERDRYRDSRDYQHPYRGSDRRREDPYSDSRAPKRRPAAYDEDPSDRDRRHYPADHSEKTHGASSRASRRSTSPRLAPPPPRPQSEAPPPPPPEPSANKTYIGRGGQKEGETAEMDAKRPSEQVANLQRAVDEDSEDEDAMAAMMGFGGFGTTKNKKVSGNDAGAAEIKKERTWRQYMNRKGGFNRPLDKIK